MTRLSTIELFKEQMKFSVGHFTIFSETDRENFHGHNYTVKADITMEVDSHNGLTVDYRLYKKMLIDLCKSLNQTFLMPEKSPYLKIIKNKNNIEVLFDSEKMVFLPRDILLLPISNITVEELAQYFIDHLIQDKNQLSQHAIHNLTIKIFSGPGQSGSAHWNKNHA